MEKYAELKLANAWTDFTPDIRGNGKITMVHGKANEQTSFTPARCTFLINNADGQYSDVNQNSPLFGLIGPNTEVRIMTKKIIDTFTRTVANGMGTGDSGQTYTLTGTAANFDITGTAFTLVTSTTTQAATFGLWGDVHLKAQMSASADTRMGLTKRMANGDRVTAYLDLAANSIDVNRITDGITYTATEFSRHTMTLTPATNYWMILAIDEQIKVKVWTGSEIDEPDDWQISCWTDYTDGSTEDGKAGRNLGIQLGEVGMYAQATAGSQTVTFDNFSAREIRFHGEIPAWPPSWDNTGIDAYVSIEASGVTRRLNARNTPVVSPIRRSLTGKLYGPHQAAYWALEDTLPAPRYKNVVKGGEDILTIGAMKPASFSGLTCTDPIPQATRNLSGFRGQITNSPSMTNNIHLKWIYVIPDAGLPATSDIATLWVDSPNVDRWIVRYTNVNGGSLETFAYNNNGGLIGSTGAASYGANGVNGNAFAIKLDLEDDGTGFNTEVRLGVTMLDDNQDYHVFSTFDNVANTKAGSPVEVLILTDIDGAIGHISIGDLDNSAISLPDNPHVFFVSTPYESGIAAYQDERSVNRFVRLCLEEGIWGQASSDYSLLNAVCNRMGPQPRGTFLSLLQDCETVEHGILYELRDTIGYGLRTNLSLWNRLPFATLNYTDAVYSGAIKPTNDDAFFKNSVTVTGPGGQRSQVHQLTTGRKSVANAGDANGDYPINFYPPSNDGNHAQWTLRFLSWDEQRVPTMQLELHRDYFQASATRLASASLLGVGRNFNMTNNPVWMRGTLVEMVTGYTETIDNLTRNIVANCVPYGPYKVAVYLATDSNVGFRIGWDNASVNTLINASSTTLSVKKTTGVFHTGADTHYPYYVIVDSEVMKVTNVTGASSPFSFTVDRGQRDTVAKTHAVDAPVLPYDFPVIGLAKKLT